MTLNEELSKLRQDFIIKHNLSCSTCEFWEKNKEGKCASKEYCIVKDNILYCAYKQKKETFRKDWRVYFCPHCGKTFTVSEAEYVIAQEKYLTQCEEAKKIFKRKGIFLRVSFELQGHPEWIYRFDEDYTEEIKKYESTDNKS
jgi:hypothetical protein